MPCPLVGPKYNSRLCGILFPLLQITLYFKIDDQIDHEDIDAAHETFLDHYNEE